MTFHRVTFFFVLLVIVLLPSLIHKYTWLAGSKKTIGTLQFTGQSQKGELHNYYTISFLAGKDSFKLDETDIVIFKDGDKVPVCYQEKNPKNARIDVFPAIWGDTIVYGGLPVIILIIIFLDHRIIPFGSKIKLQKRRPFVLIEHV